MTRILVLVCLLGLLPISTLRALEAPDPKATPGDLCRANDADFDAYYYDEQVPRCKRHVTKAMKQKVADIYDVDESDWGDYEFDHLIPLCAGGANQVRNLWPQPLDEAKSKDKVEDEVCGKMKRGTMTQRQAVARIHQWFDEMLRRQEAK